MAEGKKKLGEMLVEAGLINELQLKAALSNQKSWGGRLGTHLIQMGFLTEDALTKFLSKQLSIPYVNLYETKMSKKAISVLSAEIVEKYHILPIGTKVISGRTVLFMAMSDPTNIEAIDEIQFLTGLTVRPVVASDSALEGAIGYYYHGKQWTKRTHETPTAPESQDNMVIVRGMIEETSLSNTGRRRPLSPPSGHHTAHSLPSPGDKDRRKAVLSPQESAAYKPRTTSPEEGALVFKDPKEKTLVALISLLIKKGIITKDEFDAELVRHGPA